MLVLNTTSPKASPSAPKDSPSKTRPSANARIAFMKLLNRRFFIAGCRKWLRTGDRADERIHHDLIALFLIEPAQLDPHPVCFRAGNIFRDVVRPQVPLAMAAVV